MALNHDVGDNDIITTAGNSQIGNLCVAGCGFTGTRPSAGLL